MRWLRERATVLVLVIVLVVAAVVIYIIHSVKPKRVKVRAGVLKIITLDFEADGGGQPDEPVDALGSGGDLKAVPPVSDKDDAA